MSDGSFSTPRPVSLITVLAIFVLFAAFLVVLDYGFLRHPAPAAFNLAPEKMSKDQLWQATPDSRLDYLRQLREKQARQLDSYGWADRKSGAVQIPIDRAMGLVAQQYGKSPSK